MTRRGAARLALALCAAWPAVLPAAIVVQADAPYAARAELAFRLDVERFLYLQVGTPGSVVDTVKFDLGATEAVRSGAGPVGPVPSRSGPLQVIVQGNAGSISLSVTNSGSGRGLANGTGGFLSFRTLSTLSDNPSLPAPQLADDGGTTVVVPATGYGGRVTQQTARWTYVFDSPTLPPAGSYSGQVTYTASMP